jgi:protein tyrosine phosphatase (PTP) superfamily phosphohydrolase (DUF442 family)
MSKIGDVFKGVKNLAKYEAQEIADAAKNVGKASQSGQGLGEALGSVAKEVGDAFVDAGAASIGFAEMFGLKYPVKAYNFKVSPELTRGARLDADGIAALKAQGFKGIVNLCAENDGDSAPAAKAGLASLHLNIIDNTPPTNEQMKQFLDFATANQPTYVHCEAGQGRTGCATACYRMAVEGWPADKAIAEAKQFGLKLPDQIEFLEQFGQDLAAGKIAGYPKAA